MDAPPGPTAPRILQSLSFLRSPCSFMSRNRRRFGDVFSARFLGSPPIVYLSDPGLVRALFAEDERAGLAGEARRPYFEPLVGPSSLLVIDGERWLSQRKLVGPPLQGAKIGGYRSQIAEIAADQASRWPTGTEIELRPRMQAITLEVILRVIFGLDEGLEKRRLRELLPRLIEGGQWLIWMPERLRDPLIATLERRPALRRFAPFAGALDVRDEVDRILYEEIDRRRAAPDLEQRHDVLSHLLLARDEDGEGMTDRELRDELVTLLEAGHETTATALAWAFERLVRTPAAIDRLRASLAAGESDYLGAVVKETLRSRPVVIDVIRLLREPLRLGGYEVPAGWFVAPATLLIHQLPEHFPDPAEFRPERFLEHGAAEAWLPFGGGKRRCVGANLAQLELATVIEEVLSRFEVAAVDPEPERARLQHVTLVPSRMATVKLALRAETDVAEPESERVAAGR